ncbi:hypothetical protein XENORESO_010914, partial [Xenotaenia resolanae]
IFAPLSKISKPLEKHKSSSTKTPLRPPRRIDVSRITSKINTGKNIRAAHEVCFCYSDSLETGMCMNRVLLWQLWQVEQ